MELKLFAAKRNCGYCGGLIVVAANDIKEAYEVYKKWAIDNIKSWIYDRYEDRDGQYDITNQYPRETWYEIQNVKAICDAPRVIDEDGYTE